MTFDPKTLIEISQELSIGNTQAHLRSVINRAYYGVFGYLRNDLRIYSEGSSVHRDVYETLIRSLSVNKKIAGKKLEGFFLKRKEADYKHHLTFPESSKEYWIKEAQEIIRLYNTPDDEEDF